MLSAVVFGGQMSRPGFDAASAGRRHGAPTSPFYDLLPRLLDISGRSIMSLSPGPNDVSHLSPGIYFVHEEPSAAGRGSPIVRKVMVLR